MIWSAITGAIGLAKSFMGYQEKKLDNNLDGFKTAAGIDSVAYGAYLQAVVAINAQKLIANAWWGAKVIIFTAGVAASLQFSAVMLDSMPFPGHAVGSWGVPKPPPPYDGYQRDILMSFFLVMPAMPLVSAISQWLGRR